MGEDAECGFFEWIIKNKEWRVDYVHKVGFKTIGLSVSLKGSQVKKEVIFDMQGDKTIQDALTEAQSLAMVAVADGEPMATVMVPQRLVGEYTALLQKLMADQ